MTLFFTAEAAYPDGVQEAGRHGEKLWGVQILTLARVGSRQDLGP